MNDLFSFLGGVFGHWIASMTGIASLAIAIWQQFKGERLNNKIFWSISGLCFFIAFFSVWRDERVSYLNTQKELEAIKKPNAPSFMAEIEQVVVEDDQSVGGARIFIHLSIRNVGANSIAEKFTLHIDSDDFEYKNGPREPSGEYTISLPNGSKLPLSPQDFINITEKVSKPIEHGGRVRGWLMFVAPEVKADFIRRPEVNYNVSFVDILNRSSFASYRMPAH